MFIQTESTDSPDRIRFHPGREVLGKGSMDFPDRAAAARSPLALKLFAIEGVAALAFGPDWIDVTLRGAEWQHARPALLGAIMDHFMSGTPVLLTRPAAEQGSGAGAAIEEEIENGLRLVIDPELGYNIVDIGLIYKVTVSDAGAAHIVMTTTTVGCPATDYLMSGARGAAEAVEGVTEVEVELSYDPHWEPAMMSPRAKEHFGIRD